MLNQLIGLNNLQYLVVKKAIHKETWQHPKSKQWSCIDSVVMRQSCDCIRRGAVCNTDHNLVMAKVRIWQCAYMKTNNNSEREVEI